MTFLELVEDLATECGVASTPTAVANQTGEALRLVNWVRDAYRELQARHGGNWRWLRRNFTFNTVASTRAYAYGSITDVDAAAAITRFRNWRVMDPDDRPKIYLTADGVAAQRRLIYVPWEWYKDLYLTGTEREQAPVHITIDPKNQLQLGPTPDDIYTVTGDFFRSAQVLTDAADEPEMPDDYHKVIVYMAMKKYAGFEAAPEVMIRAKAEIKELRGELDVRQGPEWILGQAMA